MKGTKGSIPSGIIENHPERNWGVFDWSLELSYAVLRSKNCLSESLGAHRVPFWGHFSPELRSNKGVNTNR